MKDIPALKKEPLMPHENLYSSALVFKSKTRTWDHVVRDLGYEDFWGIVTGHDFLRKIADDITTGLGTKEEKMKAVVNWVKTNVEWNGVEDYYGEEPSVVLQKKRGTAGDINLLLGSLLRKAGFDVGMVLLSTRDNGNIDKSRASYTQFNYALCMVMDDSVLLDATDKFLPYNLIPANSLNYEGFIVHENFSGWITFPAPGKMKSAIQATMTLSDDGVLEGDLLFTRDGYEGRDARQKLFADGRTNYPKSVFENRNIEILRDSIIGIDDVNKPLKENYTARINDKANATGDKIYLDPYVIPTALPAYYMSPTRFYPIDLGRAIDKTYIANIQIPEGYSVEELPAGKILALPGNAARFTIGIQHVQNRIIVTTKWQHNKVIIMPHEYPDFREFYSRVREKLSEQIVLTKVQK